MKYKITMKENIIWNTHHYIENDETENLRRPLSEFSEVPELNESKHNRENDETENLCKL